MFKKIRFPTLGTKINLLHVWLLCILTLALAVPDSPPTAVLLNTNPVNIRRGFFYHPFRVVKKRKSPPFYDSPSRSDEDYYYDSPSFSDTDAIHFQVDDAVDNVKYSSPVIESNPTRSSNPPYREKFTPSFHSMPTAASNPSFKPNYHLRDSYDHVTKDYKHFSSDFVITEATVTSNYRVNGQIPFLSDQSTKEKKQLLHEANKPHLSKNNFTEVSDSQLSEPSDKISNSRPVMLGDDSRYFNNKHLQPDISTLSATNYSLNVTTTVPFIDNKTSFNNASSDVYSNTHIPDSSSFTSTVDLTRNETLTTPSSFDEKENFSHVLPPVGNSRNDISPGALAGVIIAILMAVTILSSSVIYLLYKKFNGKCTSVVDSKFNSDNCGYLDDSLRSSIYLNNHIELPKENSEEMTSLDNDSFLNSLETMTIQNYWADNTKNTKV